MLEDVNEENATHRVNSVDHDEAGENINEE